MSRSARYALIMLFLATWAIAWNPVSDLATRVMASLEQYMLRYPPEKVYLMTDKPHYAVGENVWFKGWLVNGADHYPNSPSRIVYVELVAPDQTVVLQQTSRVVEGTLKGDFFLPHQLPSGSYIIRAYTSWMRNFSHDFFFQRQLIIGNLAKASNLSVDDEQRLRLRFFPEGGDMVSGIPAVMGIEATDLSGAPIIGILASIQNNAGEEITRFKVGDYGLGKVEITPVVGQSYRAVVLDSPINAQIGQSFELPTPVGKGFMMHVQATDLHDIGIRILNNVDAPEAINQEILLLGHVRGIVYYAAIGRANRDEFIAQIDRNRFPPGIIHFTLFTESGTPVAERLVYNPDPSPLTVSIESHKDTYSTRELAQVTVAVKDANGEPVDGNLAISVTDAGQVDWDDHELTIRTYLQLVSDMDRPIIKPGIFDHRNDTSLMLVDNLMLTRGWRRFDWQKVMSADGPNLEHTLEQGLTIRGSVINKRNKRVTTGQNVILALLGDVKEFYDTETDESGNFLFANVLYPDSTEVIVQTIDERKKRHYDIMLDTIVNFDSRRPTGIIRDHGITNERYESYLSQSRAREQIDRAYGLSNDVRQLGEITVTAEREALPPPQRRSLIVEPDRVINAEDVGGYASNPLEMLRGRTAAFRVTGVGRDMTVTFNRGIAWGGDPVPLFILDGMEVDLQTLVSIPASNVESIELLIDVGSLAIYGSRGSNGVIAVNTKPGGAVFAAREGIINRAFAGYYVPREFYAPDYSEQLSIHEKPDSRSTIWWEPNVALSASGNASVRFWTSDDAGPRFQNRRIRYRVHVEGITSAGKPIVGNGFIIVQ